MKFHLTAMGIAALFLIGGTCQNSGQNIFNQMPAAQKPVIDSIANNSPAGAPFFQSRDLTFHVPWPTSVEVNIDGYLLQDRTQQGCGDEGCYVIQSQNENPAGQRNYTIRVSPPAYKRRINQIKIGIVDVSLNPSLSGPAAVSDPAVAILLEGIGGTLPGTGPAPGTPEFAARDNRGYLDFQNIGLSTAAEAQAYYNTIDPPPGKKLTLNAWKKENGFDSGGDDAKAVYYNAGDLGFGRGMHMKRLANGDIAYYVSNYPTVEDARRGSNLVATVAMEYSPLPNGGPRVTKFYVFDNKGTEGGNRVPDADLDGDGGKFIPKLCVICHGGKGQPQPGHPAGDLEARFLPFDLAPSSFQYSTAGGSDRPAQEAEFKKLNQGILDTNKSAATKELISKWYGGPQLPNAAQDSEAVPDLWTGHEGLYRDTVRTSCRACHITRDAGLDFASYQSFNNFSPLANIRVCTDKKMPNAKVTYQRFWLERNPSRLQPLLTDGLNGFQAGTTCPN